MNSDGVHIGLIGCGNWGQNILRDLKKIGCKVSVVAKSTESKNRAKLFNADSIVSNLQELRAVDGYIVATPSSTHGNIIEQILSKNPKTPIFTEKPMCLNPKQAERIVRKAQSTVFVMDKWRYHAGVLEIAKIAKTKKLGKVIGLKTTRVGWGNPHDDTDCIWHLLPHDLSIGLEIFGKIPKPQTAVADFSSNYPIGIIAFLGDSPWQVVEVSCRYPEQKREIRLFCEKGVVVLDGAYSKNIRIVLTTVLDKKRVPKINTIPIENSMPLYKELETFIKFIKKNGPPPKSSAREGMENVKVISELRSLAGI